MLGKRLLIVEDEFVIALDLQHLIEAAGHQVVGLAANIEDALALIEASPIDGAVLDINLRGQPCFPMCVHLRRWKIPFLFLTGSDTSQIPKAFRDVPLLAKPFVPEELRSTLTSLLVQSRSIKRAA